jgi:hypothetical protein
MGKERVAFEGFDNGNDSIMATDPQVISLGDIVGQDHSRVLTDSREDSQ